MAFPTSDPRESGSAFMPELRNALQFATPDTITIDADPVFNLAANQLAVSALLSLPTTFTVPDTKTLSMIRLTRENGQDNVVSVGVGAVASGIYASLKSDTTSDITSNTYAFVAHVTNLGPGITKGIHAGAFGDGTSTGVIMAGSFQIHPVPTSDTASSGLQVSLTSTGASGRASGLGFFSFTGDSFLYGVGQPVAPVPYVVAAFQAWMATGSAAGARAFQVLNNAGSELAYVHKDGSAKFAAGIQVQIPDTGVSYATRINTFLFNRSDLPTSWLSKISYSMSGAAADTTLNFELATGAASSIHVMTLNALGYVGIGTSAPSVRLHSISTTEQLRLGYDASNYVPFTVSSSGDLTVAPTGGDLVLTGNQLISGRLGVGAAHATYLANFSGSAPLISWIDTGANGVRMTQGTSGGYSGWGANRDFATGTIFDAAKHTASYYMFTDASDAYHEWATSQTANGASNTLMRLTKAGNLGLGTGFGGAVSARIHALSTTEQLRLGYDASNYASFTVGSGGVLTITPTSGSVMIAGSTASLFLKDTSTGFQSSSTTVINPAANNAIRSTSYTSGLLGWNISALGNAEFNNVDVRGAIHASIFTYNAINVTAGTQLITPSGAKLKSDVVVTAGPTYGTTTFTIDVVDQEGLSHAASQLFAVNDILRLKDGLVGDTWFKVTAVSDQTTFWRYTASIQAGTANVTYRAGMGVPDYGVSGKGGIMLTADQTNAPYLQMFTHAATFSSADASGTLVITPQLRLGNLNGSYGYVSDIYGLGTGQYGAASKEWLTVDQTNGIRIGNNATVVAQWATSGAITIGQVAAGQDNILISSGALQLRNNTTVWIELGSTGVITIGQVAAAQANTLIASGALSMRINTTSYFGIDTSGNVTMGNVATDQGNAFWNATNKRLEFRGSTNGTVVQAYVDTTGAIMAGGGNVIVNSGGVSLIAGTAAVNELKWYDSTNLTTALTRYFTQNVSSSVQHTIYTKQLAGVTTGLTQTVIRNLSDFGECAFWLVKYDNSHATLPGVGYASLGASHGLVISGFVTPLQPVASTILELQSTTGAFLPPRMTTTQRDALTATDGHLIYNSTTGAMNYRKAGAWVAI